MIKNINKSDLSASFGKQNRHSLIADIDKTLSTFNYVLSSMSLSCIVTDDIGKLSNLISDLNGGTVVIVSSLIVEGNEALSSRTAYALVKDEDGIHGHWEAFNGNYNAKNIYFDHDLQMAGDYVNVGAVSKGSLTAVSEFKVKGKSLEQAMSDIFLKDADDATITIPNLTVQVTTAEDEVGTTLNPKYKLAIDYGSYSYGSIDSAGNYVNGTGVVKLTLSAVDLSGYSKTDVASGTEFISDKSFTLKDSELTILTGYYSWLSGNVPATKAHNKSTTKTPISEGNKTFAANLTAGYRKSFWGAYFQIVLPSLLSSDNIRNDSAVTVKLQNGKKNYPSSSSKTDAKYEIPDKAKQIVFAIPKDTCKKDLCIYLAEQAGMYFAKVKRNTITNGTTEQSIQCVAVNDASGNNPILYDLWIYESEGGIDKAKVAIMWE